MMKKFVVIGLSFFYGMSAFATIRHMYPVKAEMKALKRDHFWQEPYAKTKRLSFHLCGLGDSFLLMEAVSRHRNLLLDACEFSEDQSVVSPPTQCGPGRSYVFVETEYLSFDDLKEKEKVALAATYLPHILPEYEQIGGDGIVHSLSRGRYECLPYAQKKHVFSPLRLLIKRFSAWDDAYNGYVPSSFHFEKWLPSHAQGEELADNNFYPRDIKYPLLNPKYPQMADLCDLKRSLMGRDHKSQEEVEALLVDVHGEKPTLPDEKTCPL